MKHERVHAGPRRPANLSLPESLVSEAKELGVNISRACEAGLAAEVKRERTQRWIEENRPAMEWWNRWVRDNGNPLGHHRQF